MQPQFRVKVECEPAVGVVLAGMKASFSHAELRHIVKELQEHLSPHLGAEECSKSERYDEWIRKARSRSVQTHPRTRPGFGA